MNTRLIVKVILVGGCVSAGVAPTPHAYAQADKPVWSRDLARDFDRAYQEKDWPRAIEIGNRWTAHVRRNPTAAYNLACAYALHGDAEHAVEWLTKSIERGFVDVTHIRGDSDLDSIRSAPGYGDAIKLADKAYDSSLDPARNSKPLIFVPPDLDPSKPAPLVVVMHGYGSSADQIAQPWRETAARFGAVLAAPRAVRMVPQSSGFSWNNIEEADMIVSNAVKHCKGTHNIDPKRIVLTGFSQGGTMTFALAAEHPDWFCGVIPMAGHVDPTSAAMTPTPTSDDDNTGSVKRPRYYLAVGERDRPALVEQNKQAAKTLTAAGYDVRLVVFPGVGHQFPRNIDEELSKALAFALNGE